MSKDIDVVVADVLAQKVLDAVDFPISIKIPSQKTEAEDMALGESEVVVTSVEPKAAVVDIPELSAALENAILDVAKQVRDGSIDLKDEDPEKIKALKLIAATIPGPGKEETDIIINASEEVGKAIGILLDKTAVSVDVLWVKVEVSKPKLKLGNPIVLSGMACKVQAKIQACIRVLGKRFCIKVTTPQIQLEARELALTLTNVGPVTYALPKFTDLDIVIKIKIFKWYFTIRIGITSVVNEQLRKEGPIKLLDLSYLEQTVPYSLKNIKVKNTEYVGSGSGLVIGVEMDVN